MTTLTRGTKVYEILEHDPRPVSLSSVLKHLDRPDCDLIACLEIVTGWRVNVHDPNDAERKRVAQTLADLYRGNPGTDRGHALQFLRRYAQEAAHRGGF